MKIQDIESRIMFIENKLFCLKMKINTIGITPEDYRDILDDRIKFKYEKRTLQAKLKLSLERKEKLEKIKNNYKNIW